MAHEPEPFAWNFCPICGKRLTVRTDGEKERPHCVLCRRFYYRNPLPAVCCVVMQNDQLLLAQRAIEPCRGGWALPGGFVELGETTEEAVVREMREETGLHVKALRLIGVSTQQSLFYGAVSVMGYAAHEWSGDLVPGSDALDVRFFPAEQRPIVPFTAHQEIISLFEMLRF